MPLRTLATVAIAASLIGPARAQRTSRYDVVDESTITRTLAFAAGGSRTLDVRNLNGFIHVEGTSGPDVQMSIHKTVRAETAADKAEAERDVRLEFSDAKPTVEAVVRDRRDHVCGEPHSDGASWERARYDVRFDFTIRVPRDTKLRLCTINSGDLIVTGTAGAFTVDNVNGRIEMNGVAGAGHAHTVNGPVKVTFTANPTEASSFKTVNGNVDVTFVDGLSADFSMKTFNGGLFTDFDAQPLGGAAPASSGRRDGRFVYRGREFTRVRVGRGGPELSFETLNGNVRALRGASGQAASSPRSIAAPPAPQTAADQVIVPLTDPSKPAAIHVSLVQGGITVRGTNRRDVMVTAHPDADRQGRRFDPDATGLRRLPQTAGYRISEEGNRVTMSAENPNRAVRFEIEVPRRSNLVLKTVNGGDIRVETVEGDLDVENTNGGITLDGVAGPVLAETINGPVDVTLAPSAKATLRLRSDRGQVYSDFDVQTTSSSRRSLVGTINGGGPALELRTLNGRVSVRKGR